MPMPRLMKMPSLNSCATRWRICSRLKTIAASQALARLVLHETEVEVLDDKPPIVGKVAGALFAGHARHQVNQNDRPADEAREQHCVADRFHDVAPRGRTVRCSIHF